MQKAIHKTTPNEALISRPLLLLSEELPVSCIFALKSVFLQKSVLL